MGDLSYTTGGESNLVSFKSAARVPITSLKAHFQPKQDLHGYGKPWPAGGGNNIWDEEWEIGSLDTTTGETITANNRIRSKNYIPISPETTYYWLTANMQFVGFMYDENYDILQWPNETTNYKIIQNTTFTTSADAKYFKFYCTANYGTTYNNDIAINYPSTVTTYSPYENICPIEGWNSCEIYHNNAYTPLIPNEYQEVEYVEGKDAPIDLNYIIKEDPRVIITMKIKNNVDQDIMGFKINTQPSFIIDPAPAAGRWYNRYYATNAMAINSNPPILGEKQTWEFGNITKLNGQTVYTFYNTTSAIDWSTNTQKFYLFGARNEHDDLVIYNFELYDGNTLVRKLIPCYRKNDNVVGMYDTISNTFFINEASKGQLIAGPDTKKIVPITFPVTGKNKFNWNVEYSHSYPTTSDYQTARTFTLNTYVIGLSSNNYYRDNYTNWVVNPSVSNGVISFESNKASGYGIGFPLSLAAEQTYFLSGTQTGNGAVGAIYYDKNGEVISYQTYRLNNTITIPKNTITTVIIFYATATETSYTFSNIQLELGDTATTYEPYDSNNTVYGGYVDVAKGEVVATNVSYTIDENTIGTFYARGYVDRSDRIVYVLPYTGANKQLLYCNMYPFRNRNSAQWNYMDKNKITGEPYNNNVTSVLIGVRDENITNITDYQNWISTHGPIQVVYELAAPIHYPISKTELKTFLNQNNIWSNTNDNTEVSYAIHDTAPIRAAKHRIAAAEPHIATVSGSLAHFETDMIAPIKNAKIYFNPVQEGSEDPSPSNIRNINGWNNITVAKTGKNVAEFSLETYGPISSQWVNGSGQWWNRYREPQMTDYIKNVPFTFSATIDATNAEGNHNNAVKIWGKKADDTWGWLGREGNNIAKGTSGLSQITLTNLDYHAVEWGMTLDIGSSVSNPMVEIGSTATQYESYNGSTFSITFPLIKQNLFDKNDGNILGAYLGSQNNENKILTHATSKLIYIPCSPNTTYTLIKTPGQRFSVGYTTELPANGVTYYNFISNHQGASIVYTTGADAQYLVSFIYNGAYDTISADEMLSSIQIGQGADTNTIYGGYIDLINGKIIQTYYKAIIDGSGRMTLNTYDNKTYTRFNIPFSSYNLPDAKLVNTRQAPYFDYLYSTTQMDLYYGYISSQMILLGLPSNFTTVEQGATYLHDYPLTCVYELATPIEYQLTPQQLTTLKGTNNIWSNSNGPIEISYYTH